MLDSVAGRWLLDVACSLLLVGLVRRVPVFYRVVLIVISAFKHLSRGCEVDKLSQKRCLIWTTCATGYGE